MSKPNILTVDDEPINLEIMEELLQAHYDLTTIESGESCIEALTENRPDLILLDVKMPGIDGLETCRRVKADPATQDIPVIFVSALSSVDEKMAGYEAGGDDYVAKPFDEAELRAKIDVTLSNHQKLSQVQQNSQDAMAAAMTAMTNAGELGGILNFFRNSFGCNDFEALGELLVNAHREHGLNISVLISNGDEQIKLSTSGVIHSLEFSVIEKLRTAGRIYDFGQRTVFNYDNLSILVLNMPVDDADKYGRFKDNIVLVGEGAQARIEAMIWHQEQLRQKDHLDKVVAAAREALARFEREARENKFRLTNEMEGLVVKVERLIITLGMTEEQEEVLLKTIKATDATVVKLFDEESSLGELLDDIIKMMDQ